MSVGELTDRGCMFQFGDQGYMSKNGLTVQLPRVGRGYYLTRLDRSGSVKLLKSVETIESHLATMPNPSGHPTEGIIESGEEVQVPVVSGGG
eukprot:2059957-Pyramimonas_sp.AAC.1